MHRSIGLTVIVFFWACLYGCSSTDSDNVTTEGLRADIRVEAHGTGNTEVRVELSVGSGGIFGTHVELSEGDSLTATDGITMKTLRDDGNLVATGYETTFATDTEDTPFTVSLIREDGNNAEQSIVTLPAPFDVSVNPSEFSGTGTPITVTWTNSGKTDPLSLTAESTCTEQSGGETSYDYFVKTLQLDDDGQQTFTLQTLTGETDFSAFNLGCEIDLLMTRKRTGILDPGYGEGGTIRACRIRERHLQYTP